MLETTAASFSFSCHHLILADPYLSASFDFSGGDLQRPNQWTVLCCDFFIGNCLRVCYEHLIAMPDKDKINLCSVLTAVDDEVRATFPKSRVYNGEIMRVCIFENLLVISVT
ncbi:unnamed protein product [Haemonchus placei]|uniref:Uncharacterized protein n=1 Tax=Haemonchus placei TaxID=6290 RepID=A0A0N4X1C4_HAEPC|nr:unnamed protein product [Haemonchus placei]